MHHLFTTLRFRLILLVFLAVLPALGVILYSGLEQRRLAVDEAQKDRPGPGHARLRLPGAGGGGSPANAVHPVGTSYGASAGWCGLFGPVCQDLGEAEDVRQYFGHQPARYSLRQRPTATPSPQLGRSHFEQALQTRDFAIGEYGIGRASGKPTIHFAYPVIDHGVVQGVVSASIDLNYLNTLVAKTDLPAGAMLTVIDRDGIILARHPQPEQWVGKRMPEVEIVKIVLAKKEGVAEAVGIDGVLCLFAFYSPGSREP